MILLLAQRWIARGKASQPPCGFVLQSHPSLITFSLGVVSMLNGKACFQLGSSAGLFVSDPHARQLVHEGRSHLHGCLHPTLMLEKQLVHA